MREFGDLGGPLPDGIRSRFVQCPLLAERSRTRPWRLLRPVDRPTLRLRPRPGDHEPIPELYLVDVGGSRPS